MLAWVIGVIFVTVLSVQLFHLYRASADLQARLVEERSEVENLVQEHTQLQADIHYFSDPENLAKELKAKFDYKRPGEKLIKIQ